MLNEQTQWVQVHEATPSEIKGRYPDGVHIAWFVAGDRWRLLEHDELGAYRCRGRVDGDPCPHDAVAALNRSRTSAPRWWMYCTAHMYGRRVEHGQIIEMRVATRPARRSGGLQ